jgi:hypothetical protein
MSATSFLKFRMDVPESATFAVTALPKIDTAPQGVELIEPNADIFSEYFVNTESYSMSFMIVNEAYPQTLNAITSFENNNLQGQIQNSTVTVAQKPNNNKYFFVNSTNIKSEVCGTVGSGEEVAAPCGVAVLTFGVGDVSHSYIITCEVKTDSGLDDCIKAIKTLKVDYQS